MLKTALLFQDHMTLQRDKEIPVWGTADPGASVSVSLQGKTSDTAADSGRFSADLSKHRFGKR